MTMNVFLVCECVSVSKECRGFSVTSDLMTFLFCNVEHQLSTLLIWVWPDND